MITSGKRRKDKNREKHKLSPQNINQADLDASITSSHMYICSSFACFFLFFLSSTTNHRIIIIIIIVLVLISNRSSDLFIECWLVKLFLAFFPLFFLSLSLSFSLFFFFCLLVQENSSA